MPTIRTRACALSFAFCAIFHAGLSAQEAAPAATDGAATAQAAEAERPARTPRRDRNVITREEIASRTETDAFSLVYTLRPTWMRVRGQSSFFRPESIKVYVNGMRAGNPQVLRQIQANTVRRIEHLDGSRATERFGADHGAGAILVDTM